METWRMELVPEWNALRSPSWGIHMPWLFILIPYRMLLIRGEGQMKVIHRNEGLDLAIPGTL